jgi:hypothetical protein
MSDGDLTSMSIEMDAAVLGLHQRKPFMGSSVSGRVATRSMMN